jgi:hypothetical protein
VQAVYQRFEPVVEALPKHVRFEASLYTRLNRKTPQNVWTLFGQIRLCRVGYRPSDKTGDPTVFPAALALGLIQGASPALAERAAGLMSDTGMTQRTVLKRLKQDHGVGWGVKKLRQVTAFIADELAEQRHEVQVEKLLELLDQATASKGKHKPVLSAGRDGITMGLRILAGTVKEVATCGTVTVLDRRGRRLGTMYLAYVPESGQGTMSQQLTRLLTELLQRWQGPLPRLSYVTDSGDNETTYYDEVLSRMKHPRTGEKLEWIRVADYYHASERLWTMADLLFGTGQRATSWVRKMQKWLLKPSGTYRVLHSAAALRQQQTKLRGQKLKDFQRAYKLSARAYDLYALCGLSRGGNTTGQRRHGSGLQDDLYPAAQVKRHALEGGRGAASITSARAACERGLGPSVPACAARDETATSGGSAGKNATNTEKSSIIGAAARPHPMNYEHAASRAT